MNLCGNWIDCGFTPHCAGRIQTQNKNDNDNEKGSAQEIIGDLAEN